MVDWGRRSAVAMSLALAVLATSCEGSERTAPFGLESVDLPEGSAGIAAVLSEMPESLQGLAANEPSEEESQVGLSYGPHRDLAVIATDFGAREGPAWTAGEFLPRFAESGEMDVAGSDLEGELLWLTGENHALNEQGEILETFWQMWFGAASSDWVFAVSASSAEDGIALVEAFVEAAS